LRRAIFAEREQRCRRQAAPGAVGDGSHDHKGDAGGGRGLRNQIAFQIDREGTGGNPRPALLGSRGDDAGSAEYRPFDCPKLPGQGCDPGAKIRRGLPAIAARENLGRNYRIARAQMRGQAAGDAKADETLGAGQGAIDQRGRAFAVAAADDRRKAGGSDNPSFGP
jgi:hypothetical protein